MALARAGKIKPTPMKEEPMADVQKWIEELRAGKVVGRIAEELKHALARMLAMNCGDSDAAASSRGLTGKRPSPFHGTLAIA